MVPIAKEFDVPLTEVTAVFTIPCGCALSARPPRVGWPTGWAKDPADDLHSWVLALQLHRRLFANLWFLFFFRALLGIGMGAEWPAGAALADGDSGRRAPAVS